MKIKIDENLPSEHVTLLRASGFEADSVDDEGLGSADDGMIAVDVQAEDLRSLPPMIQYMV